jgi:hypothetical protein
VATVVPAGALFHYDYSVTFDPSDEEIAVLTIVLLPADDSLTGLTAPVGFLASYDSGLGLLALLPDVASFFPLAGTLSGFAFDSARAEGATTFEAFTIFASILIGDTTGPVGDATSVPEPATSVLLTIGLGALAKRRAMRGRIRSRV